MTTDKNNTASDPQVEAMLTACLPGGSIVDPQAVADSIRAWFADRKAAELTEQQGDAVGALPNKWREQAEELNLGDAIGVTHHWKLKDCADELETALAARQPGAQTFQAGVSEWMGQCFLPSLYSNMTERGDRLLEEVLELLQAHGYDQGRVSTLVDYVFGRPVGDPAQEVGGVMVTLAGYCWVAGLDMHAAGDAELRRITQPEVMAKIRRKQEAKNALHFDTPLPGDAAPPAQGIDMEPRPMDTAPCDGTMVRLLVQFTEHATEDTAGPAWTIGARNDANVGEHEWGGWQFAGWCWTHDHFTEGKGTPVGWLPLISNCDVIPGPQKSHFFSEAMRERVQAALNRVTSGHAPMRIPVDYTDVDVVLADVLAHITSQAGAK